MHDTLKGGNLIKRKLVKQIVAFVLAFAMFVIFPMAFTLEAQAASAKTFYVVTSSKQVVNYYGEKDTKLTTTTYDKNALIF